MNATSTEARGSQRAVASALVAPFSASMQGNQRRPCADVTVLAVIGTIWSDQQKGLLSYRPIAELLPNLHKL